LRIGLSALVCTLCYTERRIDTAEKGRLCHDRPAHPSCLRRPAARTAVKISEFDGRLPDLLFVRKENEAIIQRDAIYGVPDLVIEIVSPNDRPSHLIPLETDYRTLGVPEIVFIDPQKKRVRVVSKTEAGYDEKTLTEGRLELASVPGFWLEVAWLFADTQPDELTTSLQLVREAEAAKQKEHEP
jgi:Uma2 family endonuclease